MLSDIFAKDSEGKNHDVEVQRRDEGIDVHRVRDLAELNSARSFLFLDQFTLKGICEKL